ncbi:MAG: hypothetical protein ACUZ8H_03600 [Candidatus Anammoxibacter sp.]
MFWVYWNFDGKCGIVPTLMYNDSKMTNGSVERRRSGCIDPCDAVFDYYPFRG